MSLHRGDTAPDFTAETSTGPIRFPNWIGTDRVFFCCHPGDFTPVCTTKIGRTAQLADAFAARHIKPLGLSTDRLAGHLKWIKDVNQTQHTTVTFPIGADPDRKVAQLYDMIHNHNSTTAALRAVFIIDPKMTIRLTMTYPLNVRLTFAEILRVIDALQTDDAHGVATAANWTPGPAVVIPTSVKTDMAQKKFPNGWTKTRPYLRLPVL